MAGHYEALTIMAIVVFPTLTVATTIFRVYTKLLTTKKVPWEDWSMIVAATLSAIMAGVAGGILKLGLLRRKADMPWDDLIVAGYLTNAFTFAYIPGIAFTKLSILLQMMRIFTPIRGGRSWRAMAIFTAITMLVFVADFFSQIFTCFPRWKTMAAEVPGACPLVTARSLTGVINTVSDYCMLALPIFWISRLHMSAWRKVTACAVFMVGVIACAASTTRSVISIRYMINNSQKDMSANLRLDVCKAAELTAGIVCGNIPCIPAFIKHVREKRKDCNGVKLANIRAERLQNIGSGHGKIRGLILRAEARDIAP